MSRFRKYAQQLYSPAVNSNKKTTTNGPYLIALRRRQLCHRSCSQIRCIHPKNFKVKNCVCLLNTSKVGT